MGLVKQKRNKEKAHDEENRSSWLPGQMISTELDTSRPVEISIIDISYPL